mgnify:CR=1 FL=1
MPLDIFKLHTDPSKLKGYGTKILRTYTALQSLKKEDQRPDEIITDITNNGVLGDALNKVIKYSDIPIEKLEKIISVDANLAYSYAVNVLKSRFQIGEKSISKNAGFSYLYAVNVLHGRFHMGEDVIKTDDDIWEFYQEDVLNK